MADDSAIVVGPSRSGRAKIRSRIRPHVVAPGFLENPEVRPWLHGVKPAWTMLEFDSFNALPWEFLRSPPSAAMPDRGHNWRVRRSGRALNRRNARAYI
jgi:hypothetical protein